MHRANLYLTAACLLVTTAAPLAAQGFEGAIQFVSYDRKTGAPQDTLTQITKGSKLRLEGMQHGGALIMDGDKRIVLMPERKSYMVMPASMMDGDNTVAKRVGTAENTGKTATVAGVKCEVWHYSGTKDDGTPQQGDACLAPGTGMMVGKFMGKRMPQYFTGGKALSEALMKGMGVMQASENGKVVFTAVSVKPSSVPDAMFAPPSDYKAMDMGSMGRP
jgi:hypothetical protein